MKKLYDEKNVFDLLQCKMNDSNRTNKLKIKCHTRHLSLDFYVRR